MMTGLTADSFKRMQLNAGIFLKNFSYDSAADKAALATAVASAIEAGTGVLGATTGGGTFAVTPTYRQIEADGMRNAFKGSSVLDSVEVKLTTTLKEITPDNFVLALGTGIKSTSGQKTTVTMRNYVSDADYIESLCWVGDLLDSGRLVLINITNALNVAGATFTFTDKGEGTIPVEFRAHQEGLTADTAPFEIVFFDTATTLGVLTVSSAAGTQAGYTKITVAPAKDEGNIYKYKTDASTAPTVTYGQDVSDWDAWDGSADIAATTGNKITVVEATSANLARKAGSATVAAQS